MSDIYDTRYGVKGKFDIYKCNSCRVVQLGAYYSKFEIKQNYENFYNYRGNQKGFYIRFRKLFCNSKFYQLWMAFDGDISFYSYRGKGRLLDLGCNEGRGLGIYKKNGFEVEGLEINGRAAAEAKKLGFKVFNESIENYKPAELYDVVVLSNVLEHSSELNKMLDNVSRVLKPGGEVWISCPNVESWQRKIFGRFWINWHVPFHIFHFSKNTLRKLLNNSGFRINKEIQRSPSLWLTQSIISIIFAKHKRPTKHLRKAVLVAPLMIIIRFLFFPLLCIGDFLNRGDCLVVIAKKV